MPLDPVADSPLSPLADRITSVIVVLSAAAFVWVLAAIHPDPRGHGTHEPCRWATGFNRIDSHSHHWVYVHEWIGATRIVIVWINGSFVALFRR